MRVDLAPLVVELRTSEDGRQAAKGLPHFSSGAAPEVENKVGTED